MTIQKQTDGVVRSLLNELSPIRFGLGWYRDNSFRKKWGGRVCDSVRCEGKAIVGLQERIPANPEHTDLKFLLKQIVFFIYKV